MKRLAKSVNSHHVIGFAIILGVVALLLMVLSTVAAASFQLDYVPGAQQDDGISMSRVVAQEDVVAYAGREASVRVHRATQPVQRRVVAQVSGSCYAEPGTPPASVLHRESRGNPKARNASGAAGCWQFMPGTWGGYKGYSSADQAPVSVQNERAKQVWAGGAGRSHWRATCC